MGRVVACADNASMESFFLLLQKNVPDRQRWLTRPDLRLAPLRPGSSGPTTAGDGEDGWANSRRSNMKQFALTAAFDPEPTIAGAVPSSPWPVKHRESRCLPAALAGQESTVPTGHMD
ncbi:hypothetical protein GCM10027405_11060 [Arthrobacter alkaliphilus]